MVKFRFNFVGEAESQEDALLELSSSKKIAISMSSLEIDEISDDEFLADGIKKSIKQSEDYLDDITSFYEESGMIASESLLANPYVESVNRALDKKNLSKKDKKNL